MVSLLSTKCFSSCSNGHLIYQQVSNKISQGYEFLRFPHSKIKSYREFRRCNATWTMAMDSTSSQTNRLEECSVQLPTPSISQFQLLKPPDLRFDRLQPSDQDLILERKFEFGQFVAREAILDEEYWTAAWLRAESHWEGQISERYINSQKRKFAEQEFNSIKKRTKGQHGQKCTCIVTVKKEAKNVKRTVLKSVAGTLDLNIRYLLLGETFPGERVKAPLFCSINRSSLNRYGYIANLCVAKSARRQGIASNMMHFAIEAAILDGVGQVYVHVCRDNRTAQDLYRKMGFEMVNEATLQLFEDRTYLLCFKI